MIYSLLQVLKQMTWMIVAMKRIKLMQAKAKRGAENGAKDSKQFFTFSKFGFSTSFTKFSWDRTASMPSSNALSKASQGMMQFCVSHVVDQHRELIVKIEIRKSNVKTLCFILMMIQQLSEKSHKNLRIPNSSNNHHFLSSTIPTFFSFYNFIMNDILSWEQSPEDLYEKTLQTGVFTFYQERDGTISHISSSRLEKVAKVQQKITNRPSMKEKKNKNHKLFEAQKKLSQGNQKRKFLKRKQLTEVSEKNFLHQIFENKAKKSKSRQEVNIILDKKQSIKNLSRKVFLKEKAFKDNKSQILGLKRKQLEKQKQCVKVRCVSDMDEVIKSGQIPEKIKKMHTEVMTNFANDRHKDYEKKMVAVDMNQQTEQILGPDLITCSHERKVYCKLPKLKKSEIEKSVKINNMDSVFEQSTSQSRYKIHKRQSQKKISTKAKKNSIFISSLRKSINIDNSVSLNKIEANICINTNPVVSWPDEKKELLRRLGFKI